MSLLRTEKLLDGQSKVDVGVPDVARSFVLPDGSSPKLEVSSNVSLKPIVP